MEAPEIGPAKMDSSVAVLPIEASAIWPIAWAFVAIALITNIRKKVRTVSSITDWLEDQPAQSFPDFQPR